MTKTNPARTGALLALLLASCASTPGSDASSPTASSTSSSVPTETPSSDAAATSASTAPTAAPSASPSTTPSAASSTPPAPAALEEVEKDKNALILAIKVESTSNDKDKLLLALHKSIAKVPNIGTPTSKGITGHRHVTARLILEAVVETKDGYTQKAKFVGVTTDGSCPLFDLDAKAVLTASAKTPNDVDDVRAAAVEQVFNKLEAQANTIKPNASCTGEKGWK